MGQCGAFLQFLGDMVHFGLPPPLKQRPAPALHCMHTACTQCAFVPDTALESISEAMSATVTKKLKQNPVQQEKDRHEDLVRSCLRAVETIAQNVKGAMDNIKFNELYNKTIKGDKDLKEMLEKIQKDTEKQDDDRCCVQCFA